MYYSIDDIDTEGQHVPATFTVSVPGLDWLRGVDNTGPAIAAGTRVSLPLWLAAPLASTRINPESDDAFVALEEPESFAPDILNALKSGPESVDLRAQSPVFTTLALYWLSLFNSQELSTVVYDTVQSRTALILDSASAEHGALPSLDEYEKQLYRAAHAASRDLKKWSKGE